MDEKDRSRPRWAFAAGSIACALIGWWALVRGVRVPGVSLVNLGFHELGHFLTYPFPDLVTAAMGSVAQVVVPLSLAGYFAWRSRDLLGAGLCLAWAGSSAQEVSIYVADAPFERLQLIGGEHDWAFILDRLDAMGAAHTVAMSVLFLAWALVLGGIGVCSWGAVRTTRPHRSPERLEPAVSSRNISW
jgi:hypothetical protein